MTDATLPPPITVRKNRTSDQRFYLLTVCAAFAIVFVGFARSYFLRFLFLRTELSWFLIGHGALMTGWFVLFIVQIALVRTRHVGLHRRLGVFGAIYAALMVLSGVAVAIHAAARDVCVPNFQGIPPLPFMGVLLILIGVFAVLVAAAILFRRRREYHKRLMLLSVLSMISPGVFRIPVAWFGPFAFLQTGGPMGLFAVDLVLLYACVAWDSWRHRRLHPAFGLGAILIMAEASPLTGMIVSSHLWMRVATWLVN